MYSLVVCTAWAGAPVALGRWGARSILRRIYLLFFILGGGTPVWVFVAIYNGAYYFHVVLFYSFFGVSFCIFVFMGPWFLPLRVR